MRQRLKFVYIALSAFCFLSLLTNCSGAVSEQNVQKIEAAMPAKAVATPKRARKLLVFNLCKGFKHGSIPHWDKALEIMGRKTGAFQTVVSSDMAMFKAENLSKFDAVCLNNTTKLGFEELELRKSLMDFIKGGKGIIGIHAATDNFYKWPEAAKMMGGQFTDHPWGGGGTWAVKIDEPEHPLAAAFKGKGFKIKDEIYQTKPPIYSREKQLVLMSLDMSDPATRGQAKQPTDQDTGISWIKKVGKGRLFYCSLGHNNHLTWDPALLQHYLAGIQFALGDFPVDTKPKLEEKHSPFHFVKRVKIVIDQEYEGERRRILEEETVGEWLRIAGVEVVPNGSQEYDAELRIKVRGKAVSREYSPIAGTTGARNQQYSGATVECVITFTSPRGRKYTTFSARKNPPSIISNSYPAPKNAPFVEPLLRANSFPGKFAVLMGECYGQDVLLEGLKAHQDWHVGRGAVEALGEIGDARAVEPLVATLAEEPLFPGGVADQEWKIAVAKAIGKIRDPGGVEGLISLLTDRNGVVRETAGRSLANITGQMFGSDHDKWKAWWGQNKDRILSGR